MGVAIRSKSVDGRKLTCEPLSDENIKLSLSDLVAMEPKRWSWQI